MRSGAYSTLVPAVRSQLQLAAAPSCWREWRRAADLAGSRAVVKFTVRCVLLIITILSGT